jgi:hypothetical protein
LQNELARDDEGRFAVSATPLDARLFRGALRRILRALREDNPNQGKRGHPMNWKSKLILGVLTALAMMFLTYALPRGGAMRDAAVVQFPVTVGVWAIFVLLFVKLK